MTPSPGQASEAGTFDVVVERDVGGVPGTCLYQALDEEGYALPGARVAIVANTHGNEPVGALVLERLEPLLEDHLLQGSVLVVRANMAAAAEGRRHTPEGTDLNRLWDRDSLDRLARIPEEERSYEQGRALELAPLLQACDAILDLHSTSQPAPPFLVVRDDQAHARLARRLGVQRVVVGLHEDGVLGGGVTPDVGLYLGERSPRVGVTFEAGQHSDPTNRRRAFEVVVRFLDGFGMWRSPLPPVRVEPQVYEVIDAFRQVPAESEPWRFPGWSDGGGALASGRPLASFQPVEAGEVVLRRGSDAVVRAPSPFTILLPTPTADPGTDLYYVALSRRVDLPGALDVRSNDEASREAAAVERMLDVIADDELARGVTWASFDRRQVLDMAADEIMRALRIPEGHPHRRLAIVGRGEWGGGSSEFRAARRYRQAFRRAIAEGVPVDRYQLLRGASVGWLDALTSDGMSRLLERRRAKRAEAGALGSGIRLFLSAERPSTVAMLVVGDVDRALAEGDFRHVRVGLVIEAYQVEPDAESAQLRTLRFGLFSARRPFVRTAGTLLRRLRAEHAGLVRRAPLSDQPAVQEILGPQDALVPPSSQEHLAEVGEALRDLQLRLWRDALRHEVRPHSLAPRETGRWLARTMQRTGIMDAPGLQQWLLEGREVRPERLDDLGLAVRPPEDRRKTSIRPPLCAADVDGDTLMRWLGWKRFVYQRQIVPDTRGEDVDLLFDNSAIAERLARWLDEARRMGASTPGRVMVVMAGDGLPPDEAPNPLVQAHLDVLLDANVRYLRIQHARGSHLRWLKGLVSTLRKRPEGGAPAGIRFEGEHGSSINVVLLAVCDGEPDDAWSLDGWRVERCVVLVSSLGVRDTSARVGVFTEPLPGPERRVNPELLQFGRAHCQGLLSEGGSPMVDGDAELAEYLFVERIARWIERARDLTDTPFPVPEGEEERRRWLQARLGLVDTDLVKQLVREMDSDLPARPVARALWDMVVPWPEI